MSRDRPTTLKNPYDEHGAHPDVIRFGPRFGWMMVGLFLVVIAVPPIGRNLWDAFKPLKEDDARWVPVVEFFSAQPRRDDSKLPDRNDVVAHLRAVEGRIEKAEFVESVRSHYQAGLLGLLREGNRKTFVGREGWLYLRPSLGALTGYGPIKTEPDTVAKDPNRPPWRGPKEAILTFNRQLEERGVELILVPLPVKAMIYPEYVSGRASDGVMTHRDAEAFYESLRAEGVEVFDLAPTFLEAKANGMPVFLKQDTHWTPEGMRLGVDALSRYLKARPWFSALPEVAMTIEAQKRSADNLGDLVTANLALPDPERWFRPETAEIESLHLLGGEEPAFFPTTEVASPIVLLGDSFTNIYHFEEMEWGEGAGFAEHLGLAMNLPIDLIARNGAASSGVREELARRDCSGSRLEHKKAVVWAIAARDLFYSETEAVGQRVVWEDFTFRECANFEAPEMQFLDKPEAVDPIVIEATLTRVSSFPDPNTVPYPSAVFACEYEVARVVEGALPEGEGTVRVSHIAFENRKLSPAASFKVGDRQRLTLVPKASNQKVASFRGFDDTDFELETDFYAEKVEAID